MEHAFKMFGALVFVCGAGASFAFGFAIVCRWMKWAPININVTVNNPPGTRQTAEPLNAR